MSGPASLQLARVTAKTADDKLGENIVILDVRKQTSIADYFVFITGTSHIHIRALEDAIRENLKAVGGTLQRTDGQRGKMWRALDYGSLIVHIMDPKTREFYSIEKLWDQGKVVAPIRKKPARATARIKGTRPKAGGPTRPKKKK